MRVEPGAVRVDPVAQADAERVVSRIQTHPRGFLSPDPRGGFEYGTLRPVCRGTKFGTIGNGGHSEISREMLEALQGVEDQRVLLVPQIQSTRSGLRHRVGILLPRRFDVHREEPYPIVSVIPSRDPRSGIGSAIVDDGLRDRIQPILDERGLSDAVIVIPETHGDPAEGRISDVEFDAWYHGLIDEDVLPYVAARFRTCSHESASYDLPELNPSTVRSKHSSKDIPCSIDLFEAGAAKGGWTTPPGRDRETLRRQFNGLSRPVVIPRLGGYAAEGEDQRERFARWKDEALPPSREILQQLEGHREPTAILLKLPRAGSDPRELMPCTAMLPPSFELGRAFELCAVLIPVDTSPSDVGRQLYESGALGPDVIALIPDPSAFAAIEGPVLSEALREVALREVFPLFQGRAQLDIAKSTVAHVAIEKDKRLVIERRDDVELDLNGPYVSIDGHWIHLPDAHRSDPFAAAHSVERTDEIPAELQKQPLERGSFFAPVFHSEALGKDLRVGVYLPPSYDPAGKERFPVLFLLPGRSNPLHYWIEHGDLVAKLDRMMADDAQKMIVVVPDSIDSYYVNTPSDADLGGGTSGKGRPQNAQDFVVQELVGWATTTFLGDDRRLSLGGISMGGFGAMLIAAMNPDMFQSVSTHSGVIGSHRRVGQNNCTDIPQPDGPNPTNMALAGSFDGRRTKIYVDVGSSDALCRDDTLEFSAALRRRGVEHEVRVFGSNDEQACKHDWEHWGSLIEEWVAFHQRASGKPGVPLEEPPIDVTRECAKRFEERATAINKRNEDARQNGGRPRASVGSPSSIWHTPRYEPINSPLTGVIVGMAAALVGGIALAVGIPHIFGVPGLGRLQSPYVEPATNTAEGSSGAPRSGVVRTVAQTVASPAIAAPPSRAETYRIPPSTASGSLGDRTEISRRNGPSVMESVSVSGVGRVVHSLGGTQRTLELRDPLWSPIAKGREAGPYARGPLEMQDAQGEPLGTITRERVTTSITSNARAKDPVPYRDVYVIADGRGTRVGTAEWKDRMFVLSGRGGVDLTMYTPQSGRVKVTAGSTKIDDRVLTLLFTYAMANLPPENGKPLSDLRRDHQAFFDRVDKMDTTYSNLFLQQMIREFSPEELVVALGGLRELFPSPILGDGNSVVTEQAGSKLATALEPQLRQYIAFTDYRVANRTWLGGIPVVQGAAPPTSGSAFRPKPTSSAAEIARYLSTRYGVSKDWWMGKKGSDFSLEGAEVSAWAMIWRVPQGELPLVLKALDEIVPEAASRDVDPEIRLRRTGFMNRLSAIISEYLTFLQYDEANQRWLPSRLRPAPLPRAG